MYTRPPPPYALKKIKFFTRVLDQHVIANISDVYPKGWATQWGNISSECFEEDAPILDVRLGSTHTLAVN